MSDHRMREAPDYTNAAINMLGVNLLWIFFVVWMLWGFLPVLMIALAVNIFIERVADRRGLTPVFGYLRLPSKHQRDG
jgi:hypothetical protein